MIITPHIRIIVSVLLTLPAHLKPEVNCRLDTYLKGNKDKVSPGTQICAQPPQYNILATERPSVNSFILK